MVSKEDMTAFLSTEFPQTKCTVDALGERSATVRRMIGFDELARRYGIGTGADGGGRCRAVCRDTPVRSAWWRSAVTTSLTINFLRKPSAERDIIGVCRLLKVGRSLIVGEVSLYSEGDPQPVAHVVGTYSVPPSNSR